MTNCRVCPRSAVCAASAPGLGYLYDSCYHQCVNCGRIWWLRFVVPDNGHADVCGMDDPSADFFTAYNRRVLPFWTGHCSNCPACTQLVMTRRAEPIYTIGSGKAFYAAGSQDEEQQEYTVYPTRDGDLSVRLSGLRRNPKDPARGLVVLHWTMEGKVK